MPAPTYSGTIGEPTPTVSIAPPPALPSPSPSLNPTPQGPNPATESLHCYNSGLPLDRGYMIKALTKFCDRYDGVTLAATGNSVRYLGNAYGAVCSDFLEVCADYVGVSVGVINGCQFTIDGPHKECGRILREAIDQCDGSSTRYKQGGVVTSNCAVWRIDPNFGPMPLDGILKRRASGLERSEALLSGNYSRELVELW